jgi:molecular chaperone DnaK
MRTRFPVLTLSLLVFGCQVQSPPPFIVEDATPIVAAGRTTENFGIELDGVFTPLIKSGTAVPFSVFAVLSTATNGQSEIVIIPFRGTNHALGRFQVVGIPPAPGGIPQVLVTFTITERQILMSARDLTHKMDLAVERE